MVNLSFPELLLLFFFSLSFKSFQDAFTMNEWFKFLIITKKTCIKSLWKTFNSEFVKRGDYSCFKEDNSCLSVVAKEGQYVIKLNYKYLKVK